MKVLNGYIDYKSEGLSEEKKRIDFSNGYYDDIPLNSKLHEDPTYQEILQLFRLNEKAIKGYILTDTDLKVFYDLSVKYAGKYSSVQRVDKDLYINCNNA